MQRTDTIAITLADLRNALKTFQGKRGAVSLSSKAEKGLEALISKGEKARGVNAFLDNALLLDLTILCARTNPKKDPNGSIILSDLIKELDWRVPAAVRAVLDVGGISDGTCLVDCFEFMRRAPEHATSIAAVKSMLYVALTLAHEQKGTLPQISEYYQKVNSDLELVKRIQKAIPTMHDFGNIFKAPLAADAYLAEQMQKKSSTFNLFKQKANALLEGASGGPKFGKTG